MLKKWNQFIVEFVDNSSNDYIGAKMQELKDLVEGVSNGQNFIYEWENKNDHQLLVNFSTGELSVRYEFDIDDLILTKVVADKVDFTDNVESIDEGLDMIEKDIQLILGISESKKSFIKKFELFESNLFKTIKVKLSGCEVEVLDANPNNNDGGVQIDNLTITVNGDEEYNFEIASAISGDIYVDYESGDGGDFEEHFQLESFERMKSKYDVPKPSDSYLELRNFLEQNDPSCVGDSTEIDGFEIEITDFSHKGGMEFGYLEITINGEEFQIEMVQDATGSGLHTKVYFQNDEDKKKAKSMGFNIDSDESQNHFFEEYDRICTAKRP